MSELLQIESLSVEFALSRAVVPALKGLSLTVGKGDKVGLLGESGCGKTTLALAILGVLPTKVAAMSGSIRLHGKELIGASEQTLRRVRGEQIAFIPQEPALALSPVFRAGEQVADVIRAHRPWRRRRCREEAREYLQTVGFETDVERVFASYPHQLSGGQRQRVAIAQAISCQPELLVADEPTTALDPTTQADILAMLRRLCRERGMSLLMISHDPAVLAEVVDRVVVIEDGRVVESGAMREVLEAPSHPYTRALLESAPERFALP